MSRLTQLSYFDRTKTHTPIKKRTNLFKTNRRGDLYDKGVVWLAEHTDDPRPESNGAFNYSTLTLTYRCLSGQSIRAQSTDWLVFIVKYYIAII